MPPPGAEWPLVSAIVVNWNGGRYLPRCLTALSQQTVPVRVVVVDNASGDGSVGYVREHHPAVDLVELHENHGYAGGANAGSYGIGSDLGCSTQGPNQRQAANRRRA